MADARALNVVLVEDDAPLAKALLVNLRAEGWAVRWVATGADALATCRADAPHVVVLDWMLPDRRGLEVCSALRIDVEPTPGVLMLTARGSEADVVLGLDHGADDYVVKPCRPRELVARVRAVARRVRLVTSPRTDELVVRGALRLDPLRRRAWVNDRELSLTPTELELLTVLARQDRVHSRMELLEAVFDTTHSGYARNVDCHVARLRRKLEAAGMKPAPIRTLYGKGYLLEVS